MVANITQESTRKLRYSIIWINQVVKKLQGLPDFCEEVRSRCNSKLIETLVYFPCVYFALSSSVLLLPTDFLPWTFRFPCLTWLVRRNSLELLGEEKRLWELLLCLEFCHINPMFDNTLGILIFLLAATFIPGFPVFMLLLYCTVYCCVPPPGLSSPLVFLSEAAHAFNCL